MRRIILPRTLILVLLIVRVPYPGTLPDIVNPPPSRQATIVKSYIEHDWWLLTWADNSLVCEVQTDQEGVPYLAEIKADCPAEVYKVWSEQPLCQAATNNGNLNTCKGYYLLYAGSHQAKSEVVVDLPPASVAFELEGCSQTNYETTCSSLPLLRVKGVEPLPEYAITKIHIGRNGRTEVCSSDICEVSLWPTNLIGDRVSIWADSSYGDSSAVYEVSMRIRPNGDGKWQIELLGEQNTGLKTAAFALEWGAFPPLGENPSWLSYPPDVAALASTEPYQYLAGQLIRGGITDAQNCSDGGLIANGYASQCGLEQAMEDVIAWQNRFDTLILDVANRDDLSPQLLKNLIAQESQFWPGSYAPSPNEFGLGRLTESGAETILMWNESFYTQFCSQVITEAACQFGYHNLTPNYQQMLIGALSSRVNLDCSSCESGIDINRVDFNIDLISESLLANAAQVNQIFINVTGEKAGVSSSYEDLWRFTLVNYNAGAGCLSTALKATRDGNASLSWSNVSVHLVGDCQNAIPYVEKITQENIPSSNNAQY